MSFRTMFHADEENRTSDGKRQLYMCMYVLVNYDSCDIHLYIVPVYMYEVSKMWKKKLY